MNAAIQIAQHLKVELAAIARVEEWASIWFAVIRGVGARFVSKKVTMVTLKQFDEEDEDALAEKTEEMALEINKYLPMGHTIPYNKLHSAADVVLGDCTFRQAVDRFTSKVVEQKMQTLFELPRLEGSEKQIAWAEKIRANSISQIENWLAKEKKSSVDTDLLLADWRSQFEVQVCFPDVKQPWLAKNVFNQTSAKFWIENKDTNWLQKVSTVNREIIRQKREEFEHKNCKNGLKNLRHFSASEKVKAEKELVQWMSDQFDLPEGESYEAIAKDAIEEASKEKVINLFNEKAMVDSLVSKCRSVIAGWL